jgi:predicted PurR-regulated permease PerM
MPQSPLPPSTSGASDRSRAGPTQVPLRTIVAWVGAVLATLGGIWLVIRLQHVLIWVAIAMFFAVVLHPAVSALVRVAHLRRTLAALVVFVLFAAAVAGLGYLFVRPIADQVNIFVNDFPHYVADAKAGRGTIGHLVKDYDIDGYVERNQSKLKSALKAAEKPAVHVARNVVNTLAAMATIVVVTFLMLIEGPRMMAGGLAMLSPPVRKRVQTVIHEISRAVSGYVGGVAATSALAGGITYLLLWPLGVPFRGVLALWVGFTALVPIVGVVFGLIPAVIVATIHSTPAGITVFVVLVAYHIVENRTLGKWINRHTIALSPLGVVVSILAGLSLLGFLGALLALPAAGVIHVVIRDVWNFRHSERE